MPPVQRRGQNSLQVMLWTGIPDNKLRNRGKRTLQPMRREWVSVLSCMWRKRSHGLQILQRHGIFYGKVKLTDVSCIMKFRPYG